MLLRFIAPANSILYDKKVSLQVINPYRDITQLNRKAPEGANNANWCASYTSTLTSAATELEHDVLLQELADSLHLNGQLLDV